MKYKSFFQKHYFPIGLALIIGFFFVIAFTTVQGIGSYPGYSITEDEVPHTGSGIYYLDTGKYFLNPEHPPLIKDLAALPSKILNFHTPSISNDDEAGNGQWGYGQQFIFNVGNNPDEIALFSRTAILLLNCALLALLAIALKKAVNAKAGLLAAAAIAMTPLIIGHGSLITTDVASSLLQALALIVVYLMLKRPTRKTVIIAGIVTGIALLSKFNTILLFPAVLIASFIIWKRIKAYSGKTLVKILLAWGIIAGLLVLAVYIPHVWNMDTATMSKFIAGQTDPKFSGIFNAINNLAGMNVVIRAIYWYLVGVSMALSRVANAYQNTYFMGVVYGQSGAGPAYFPTLLLLKTPLTLLGFIWLGSYLYIERFSRKIKAISHLNTLLFVYALAYAAVSLATSLQLGLRHFMPVYVILVIISAQILANNWNMVLAKFKVKTFTIALLLITLVTTILAFPYYLSYFNILGGGTENGYLVATDSNYDWGQDLKQLGQWVKTNNVQFAYEDIFTSSDLHYYLGLEDYKELKDLDKLDAPSGTWVFISAHELQDNLYNTKYSEDQKYTWLFPDLYARVGTSIFIFKIP